MLSNDAVYCFASPRHAADGPKRLVRGPARRNEAPPRRQLSEAGRNPRVRLPRGEHWHAHAARHDRRRRRFRRFARRAGHPPSGARVAGRTRVTGPALALVVGAAGLHALWNALAKRSGDLVAFFCLTSAVAALGLAAPAAWIVARDGLRAAGAPFIVATVALHALYFYGLARAYRSGAYSAVYPVARGLGVALVPVIAFAALDERVSSVGALGIGLVAGGIVAVQFASGAPPSALAAGLGWAVATSVVIAGYLLVDKAGVARIHPVPYMALMEAGTAVCLLPAARRRAAGSKHTAVPASISAMYGTGWIRATPALSTSKYPAMTTLVAAAQPRPAASADGGAPLANWTATMPPATSPMPRAPTDETRSSRAAKAMTGTRATPSPRATG